MLRMASILLMFLFIHLSQHSTSAYAGEQIEDLHCQATQAVCDVVDKYVLKKKGWTKDKYNLKQKGDRHDLTIIWVVHLDDLKSISSLNGKSFALHVDSSKLLVIRELGFQ